MEINEITGQIVDSAIKVHSALGPGLLESAYEACLMYELNQRGLLVRNQVPLPVHYEENLIEVGYRIDLLVAESPYESKPISPVQACREGFDSTGGVAQVRS